eukprot:1115461-Rhodomonas_salina.2
MVDRPMCARLDAQSVLQEHVWCQRCPASRLVWLDLGCGRRRIGGVDAAVARGAIGARGALRGREVAGVPAVCRRRDDAAREPAVVPCSKEEHALPARQFQAWKNTV